MGLGGALKSVILGEAGVVEWWSGGLMEWWIEPPSIMRSLGPIY
jgi:hypothetical protein